MTTNGKDWKNKLAAWRERWSEWRGERIDKGSLYSMFSELSERQLNQLAEADINFLSGMAKRFRNPSLPLYRNIKTTEKRAIVRLHRRADKIAGRAAAPTHSPEKHRRLFTKTHDFSPQLVATQKAFATAIHNQSRKYAKRLIASAAGIPVEHVPRALVEAKRIHLQVHRIIKEKQK